MYAVIKTGGKQYRVAKDDVITIERLKGDAGEAVTFDTVLMVGDKAGTPTVEGAAVKGTIVEQGRGDKIIVFKKKRRKDYKRTSGHRQDLTVVQITDVGEGTKKKAAAKKAPAKEAAAKEAEAKAPVKEAPAKTEAKTDEAQAEDGK
jgi:large subunit ribosomal protein L21